MPSSFSLVCILIKKKKKEKEFLDHHECVHVEKAKVANYAKNYCNWLQIVNQENQT